jgi:hypothetical protein
VITVSINRTSGDACIPRLLNGGGGTMPNNYPITDTFNVNVLLAADPQGRVGELWFLTISHGAPRGPVIDFHGIVAAGDNTGLAISVTARPGLQFNVQASAHLPHVGLDTQGNAWALMRVGCPESTSAYGPDNNSIYTTPDGSGVYTPSS